ncbi:MAG: hypothetical protein KC486_06815 [Myxococcales bacterium]|nr:hypothetical protein [Myxococcales bacterium]
MPALPARLALLLPVAALAFAGCKKDEASKAPASATEAADDEPNYAAMIEEDEVTQEATALAEGPLAERAATDAAGRGYVGDMLASELSPGQEVDQEFSLDPARCYTLIAVGDDGVDELHSAITTIAPVRGGETTIVEDTSSGPVTVIGGGESCYRPEGDGSKRVRFVLRVTAGAGLVVGQLYASDVASDAGSE